MAQQPIDASAIPIPSLDASALSAGAGCLRGDGGRIRQAGADVRSSWAGLAGVYRAPEDAQLFAVMDPVATETDSFASDVERVASILESFAAEAGPLAATLVNAQTEAYAFEAKVAGNGKWDHDGGLVKQNNALVHTVNTTLVAYQAAERRAANAIEALIGGHTWHVIDPKTGSPKDPYAYGYTSIPDNAKTPWGADVQKKDGCLKSALTDVGHFAEGVGEGLWGMVKGVGTLVWDATGAGGWDKFKQAWEGLAFLGTLITPGFGPLAGMAIWGPKGYAQRVEAMGKGLVDWNEWKTDPAKAAGNVTATVATLFIPGAGEVGAVADGAKGAELAADAGKAAEVASDAGKLSKAADLGMTGLRVVSDPLGFAIKGLPKVIDLANSFKIKLAGLDNVVGHDGSLLDHEMGGWTTHADEPVAVGAHDGEPAMVGAHTGSGVDTGTGLGHDTGTGLGHDGSIAGHGGSGIGHDSGPGAGHDTGGSPGHGGSGDQGGPTGHGAGSDGRTGDHGGGGGSHGGGDSHGGSGPHGGDDPQTAHLANGQTHEVTWSSQEVAQIPHSSEALAQSLAQHDLTVKGLHDLIGKVDASGIHLSGAEAATLLDIRRSIPLPEAHAALQKVISPETAERYLHNSTTDFDPNSVRGFVNNATDVVGIKTPTDLREADGLGFANGPIPNDAEAYVMRFQVANPDALQIPLSDRIINLAGTVRDAHDASVNLDYPYTGTGFTNSSAHLVPEYTFDGAQEIQPGAEIWKLGSDGSEQIVGVMGDDGRWYEVIPGA